MTFSVEDSRPKLEARCDTDFKRQVAEFANEHGLSISQVVRQAVAHYLPDDTSTPADPERRAAYLWLRARTDDTGMVPARIVLPGLAQEMQIDKASVKHAYLDPLLRDGWIRADYGRIYVLDGAEAQSE